MLTSGSGRCTAASAEVGSLQPESSGDNPATRRATDVSRESNRGIDLGNPHVNVE
jgi:hypothetical protein